MTPAPDRSVRVWGPRLASFLGIAPIGVWTFLHLWDNVAAFGGAEPWQRAVTYHGRPGSLALTATVVLLPLLIHSVWGIARMTTSRPDNIHYPTYRNLKYLLQRVSAIGVLFFLGAHLWLAFIHPRVVMGHGELFADLAHEMRFHTPTLVVYVLGTLGVSYHLANGVYGFAFGSGLAASRAALRHFERFSVVLFVVLLAMSWGAIAALYQAGTP